MELDMRWTFDPLQIVPMCAITALYVRRCGTLSVRRRPVPGWRQISFLAGMLVLAISVISPIDAIGETQLFSVHMLQHLMLGDIAPLLIALGITGPVLRPVLAVPWLRWIEALRTPQLALGFWVANLYIWHVPVMYELALHHRAAHALEHATFMTAGLLVWLTIFEPIPGPRWFGSMGKAGFVLLMRVSEALLANIFIWSTKPFYSTYVDGGGALGWSPIHDQNTAGIIMMLEGSVVTLVVIALLLWRAAEESDQRQRMLELGVPVERASLAARYGRTARVVEAEAEAQAEAALVGSGQGHDDHGRADHEHARHDDR